MSKPFHDDPLRNNFNGEALHLRRERDDLYQTVGSHFPLAETASNVISFEKREKALAAQRCQKRIWSKLEPVTPAVAREFQQLSQLLDEIVSSSGEWVEIEDARNDRWVEPQEIVVAGIRYAVSAHQLQAAGRRPRPGGLHELRLYLCGACDLVIWPYARKYCNDACRSEYWSRLGVREA